MTGLWRVHFALSKMLALAEMKQGDQLACVIAQCLKAVHQVALDDGSWSNAVLLLPWQDPLARDLWAGEDGEMATAARYSRAIRDLQLKVQTTDLQNEGLADAEDGLAENATRRPRGPKPPKKPTPPKPPAAPPPKG